MGLRVTCPGCKSVLMLEDSAGGRPVQCGACQKVFHVRDPRQSQPSPGPVQPVQKAERPAKRPPPMVEAAPSSNDLVKPILVTLAVVLVFIVVFGGGIGLLRWARQTNKAEPPPDLAAKSSPDRPPQPSDSPSPLRSPRSPPRPPASNPPPPPPVFPPDNPPPPRVNRPPSSSPHSLPKVPVVMQNRQPPPRPALWNVGVDVPAEMAVPIPVKNQINIAIPGLRQTVTFPATPSRFLIAGRNDEDSSARQLWDIHQGKVVSRLTGRLSVEGPFALSPDGRFFAAKSYATTEAVIEIYSLGQDGSKREHQINVGGNRFWLQTLFFAGPQKLISVKRQGVNHLLECWEVGTSRKLLELKMDPFFPVQTLAPSPTGRYLVLCHDSKLRVHDLDTKTLAGEVELPTDEEPGANVTVQVAWSPDGQEIAGLFSDAFDKFRIIAWKADTGLVSVEHRYPQGLGSPRHNPFDEGPELIWLPDRSGWLARRYLVIDYQTGSTLAGLPPGEALQQVYDRRPLDVDHYLVTVDRGRELTIQSQMLSKEELEANRRKARTGG